MYTTPLAIMASKLLTMTIMLINLYNAETITESATLLPTQIQDNDARVDLHNISETNANGWIVNVNDNYGWNWKITFDDDKWKFRNDTISTLTVTMYTNKSYCAFANNCDALIYFSQNDSKYFAILMQFDNNPNAMYPGCDQQEIPTQSLKSGNVDNLLMSSVNDGSKTRTGRTMPVDDGNALKNIKPKNNATYPNESPLIIKIINNPIEGWNKYIYTNPTVSPWEQGCGFGEAWSSVSQMKILISGDNIGETLNFYQFDVEFKYNMTLSPSGTSICFPYSKF